ncbi:MAG: insulinase family protein, partial [Bacteroidales bacterium]|nr:insulinase family protein [Bacteroidales bacterium]
SYKTLFSNMAGATVIITGNVDLNTIKPLVEKYIGSLPVARKESKYVDHNLEYVPGVVENVFSYDMQTPKTTSLMVFSGYTDYNFENIMLSQALQYVMNLVYTDSIREEEGGTYGVAVQCSLTSRPKHQESFLLQFDADPDKAERLLDLAVKGFENIAKNGPTAEQMTMVRENFIKRVPENRITNGYWARSISTYYKTGVDVDTDREAVINGITAEKIQKYAAGLLQQGNTIKIVMTPAAK